MTELDLKKQFPPIPGRVHEVCGSGRDVFLAILAAQCKGDVLYFSERWQWDVLNPLGMAEFFDPSKLLIARTEDQATLLAAAEEALRDGAVPLVILELSKPLSLTEGRRLQLAAQTGRSTGLCLIAEDNGSNAAETRWYCKPVFDAEGSTLHEWKLIKNKKGTLRSWNVRWDQSARCVIVVPPVGKRPGS